MRIVVAPDSFKESASAMAVASAIADGWRRVLPESQIDLAPMADGGEGTVDTLVAALGGDIIEVDVAGPLGERRTAAYGYIAERSTAVIEMAAASGLALVPPDKRDARITTTRGTGELMRDALDRGARHIIIGIGGSATNDGGAGMAQALGYSLRDSKGNELPPGGAALSRLARIDAAAAHPRLRVCEVLAACDVDNPLCGPRGASAVFGPQKGASPEDVALLDAALSHYAVVIEAQLGVAIEQPPGAGAAGGLGGGLVAFAGAKLAPGVELIAQACALRERITGADLVITGEGRMDGQTACGKTPAGVGRIAKELGVPCIALAGSVDAGAEKLVAQGIDAVFCIAPGPMTLEESMARATELLAQAAENVARLWKIGGRCTMGRNEGNTR